MCPSAAGQVVHVEIVCIIPARGGSKGIPRKNLGLLRGKPLVAHSILHAQKTERISRIVISTDDSEIASVARDWGAEVVWRPAELCTDTASSESALLHTLEFLEKTERYHPDLVVFLQATSPLRNPGAVDSALNRLLDQQADSLLSVSPLHGFVWRTAADGAAHSVNYDYQRRPRRQDAHDDVLENGSIYIFKPWVLKQFNNRLGGRIALQLMSELESFQIDKPGDFELIERLLASTVSANGTHCSAPNGSASADPLVDERSLKGQWLPIGDTLSRIQLLVLDFDGVLTDNSVFVDGNGVESVVCNRSDGLGIGLAQRAGLHVVVLSSEQNPVVGARCRKLAIEYVHGIENKLRVLQELVESKRLTPDAVAYVGNDVNDVECLRWVGLPIAVADATPQVIAVARYTTRRGGGHGAVREVCDLLLAAHTVRETTDAQVYAR